jgi:cell division protein FtsI (penicillin-binding protein 3)
MSDLHPPRGLFSALKAWWRAGDARRWMKLRIGVLILALIALFGVVLNHIYDIQVRDGAMLQAKADDQVERVVKLHSHRGSILDRHGKALASSIEVPSIYIHPKQLTNPDQAAQDLAAILGLPPDEVLEKARSGKSFVWLARKVTLAQGEAVRELKLRGVGIEYESKRYFPQQDLAGHIVGFVGMDNEGLAGLEAAFDSKLRGGSTEIRAMRDARGQMLMMMEPPTLNAQEGQSVVLTLDQNIQRITEIALERAVKDHNAKGAVGIVMDVHTGEVLAMAQWPRFNPNRYKDYQAADWRNRAIQDAYEPGSIFKPFLYAAALSAGVITPNQRIDIGDGSFTIGEYTIKDTHYVANMTAELSVIESSNVASYKIAKALGREAFYEALKSLTFGHKTGINLPGENAGLMWHHTRWPEITFANIAFGQGISVSPMQLAVALSALGNGGDVMRPLLIKEIRDRNGNVVERHDPEVMQHVFTKAAIEQANRAMLKVVTEGTGSLAMVESYPVGGKTGTPEKINPRTRRYTKTHWMGNFIGLAPMDNPRIAVVVLVDEPNPVRLGGKVAAPAFSEIVSQTLPYMGVYPAPVYQGDAFRVPTIEQLPEEAAPPAAAVAAVDDGAATDDGLSLDADPEAGDLDADPEAGDLDPDLDPIALAALPEGTGDIATDTVTVPDLRQLSLRDAMRHARAAGLNLDARDTGFVAEQWPAPGEPAPRDSAIQVTLAPRYRAPIVGLTP